MKNLYKKSNQNQEVQLLENIERAEEEDSGKDLARDINNDK